MKSKDQILLEQAYEKVYIKESYLKLTPEIDQYIEEICIPKIKELTY